MMPIESQKFSTSDLKEPLLSIKSEESASSDRICMEQVISSSNSIQITFSGEAGYKGDLKVEEGLKAIVVKAAFVKWMMYIRLYRDGKEVGKYDIFGVFDGSLN